MVVDTLSDNKLVERKKSDTQKEKEKAEEKGEKKSKESETDKKDAVKP